MRMRRLLGPMMRIGRTMLFEWVLLWLCVCSGLVSSARVQAADPPLEKPLLQDVAMHLRAGDMRVVRPSPTDLTATRQASCGPYLKQAYQVLVEWYNDAYKVDQHTSTPSSSSDHVLDAVRVISLCTTDRPDHRAQLTTSSHGKTVAQALLALLDTASPLEGAAVAAAVGECLWISTFASRLNHDALARPAAIDSLMAILTDWDCTAMESTTTQRNSCWLGQMWAAAALQNMAAAFCVTASGRCHWEWKEEDEEEDDDEVEWDDGRPMIGLHADVTHDPKHVRLQILRNAKLMNKLDEFICINANHLPKAPSDRTWPSRATIEEQYDSSLVPWAVIGLVRNLALSPGLFERVSDELLECLCVHAIHSPDWLERDKADDAIYRLGLEKDEVCDPPYSEEYCHDYLGWVDQNGGTCLQYQEEVWCAEHGNEMGTSAEGEEASAKEACCICGGGHEEYDDDGFLDEF